MSIHPYTELIQQRRGDIGVSDHLATELPALIEFAAQRKTSISARDIARRQSRRSPSQWGHIDALQDSIDHVRTVIVPSSDK